MCRFDEPSHFVWHFTIIWRQTHAVKFHLLPSKWCKCAILMSIVILYDIYLYLKVNLHCKISPTSFKMMQACHFDEHSHFVWHFTYIWRWIYTVTFHLLPWKWPGCDILPSLVILYESSPVFKTPTFNCLQNLCDILPNRKKGLLTKTQMFWPNLTFLHPHLTCYLSPTYY